MPPELILASASPFRKTLLENAGIEFTVQASDLDERSVDGPLIQVNTEPENIALVLAEAKAMNVSEGKPGALVIGSDQTLSLNGEIFHKPTDIKAARRHLSSLSGRIHRLSSAAVIVRDGEILWRHVATADLTMRTLAPGFIDRYLSRVGQKALSSVGAYQLEGEGIQLFRHIRGDYFTVIGLPVLPLLSALRDMEVIDG